MPINEQAEARLFEIMRIAKTLNWLTPNPSGYPLMQASEVEKCLLIAMDDRELARWREIAPDPASAQIDNDLNKS